MQLYYSPGTISIAVAITLHEVGIPFEPIKVDFANAEQTKAPYAAINPKARVPALVTDSSILTETGAILDYIAAIAPGAGLLPADPLKAARMRELMYYLAATMHVNHAHGMRGARWADTPQAWRDMRARVTQNMIDCCNHIETHALQGPYVLGDAISLADPYLYVVCTWLRGDGVDPAAFAKIAAFMATMAVRESVKAAAANGMLQRSDR
jgi:glutathione S-transferase